MKKIIWTVFILGLSCGMVLSSSLNLIIKEKPVTIIKEVEKKEVKKQNTKTEDIKPKPVEPTLSLPQPLEEDVKIVIQSGYSSGTVAQILYDAKLIANKNDFKTMLTLMKASSKVRTGERIIKRGSSIVEIINVITN